VALGIRARVTFRYSAAGLADEVNSSRPFQLFLRDYSIKKMKNENRYIGDNRLVAYHGRRVIWVLPLISRNVNTIIKKFKDLKDLFARRKPEERIKAW